MEFYRAVCLVLLIIASVRAADLNEVKKNAIKRLDALVDEIQKLAGKTSTEVENREGNIKFITKHVREFGDGIIDNTHSEIKRSAKSGYIMANLMGSSNEVFRCIEYREREGVEDIDKYYSSQFLNPGRDFELKAEEYQRNLIKAWKDDYYKAINQYSNIYKSTVNDIQKATTETNVYSLVRYFERTTQEMSDIITGIIPNMTKTHIQVMRTLDQLVKTLRQYAIRKVDDTTKAIEKCFSKLYKKKFFYSLISF